jgi:hypothetical protein
MIQVAAMPKMNGPLFPQRPARRLIEKENRGLMRRPFIGTKRIAITMGFSGSEFQIKPESPF